MSALKITMVQFSGHSDGSALSAFSLAKGFRDNGWQVNLVFGIKGKVYEACKSSGFTVQHIPHKSWLRETRPLAFLKNLWIERAHTRQFVEAFNHNQSQLIYVNTSVSLPALLAAKKQDRPCVWHIREMLREQGGELRVPPIFRPILPYFLKYCSRHFVFNTLAAKKAMFGDSIGGHVIPVGISTVFEENLLPSSACRKLFNLPTGAKLIGIPGGLRRVKGQDWFLDAVRDWMNQDDSIHISLAGNGSTAFTQTLTTLIHESGLDGRVHLLGNTQDMPSFYRANDVICIPSRSESFGRCAVEAMASRVPLVTTTSGGLNEIVNNGRNGLSVPFGNNHGLVTALKQALANTSLANNLTKQAYADYKNHYTESHYQKRIIATIDKIMARSAEPLSARN